MAAVAVNVSTFDSLYALQLVFTTTCKLAAAASAAATHSAASSSNQ